jgi:antigen 43
MTRDLGRIQGGHTGHDGNGGIAQGDTPESSGSYGFIQLGGDLFKHDTGTLSLTSGLYGAAGQSSVDVKNDDRSAAGSVRDTVYSLGGYLTAVQDASGLWADMVAQGSRHSLKATQRITVLILTAPAGWPLWKPVCRLTSVRDWCWSHSCSTSGKDCLWIMGMTTAVT